MCPFCILMEIICLEFSYMILASIYGHRPLTIYSTLYRSHLKFGNNCTDPIKSLSEDYSVSFSSEHIPEYKLSFLTERQLHLSFVSVDDTSENFFVVKAAPTYFHFKLLKSKIFKAMESMILVLDTYPWFFQNQAKNCNYFDYLFSMIKNKDAYDINKICAKYKKNRVEKRGVIEALLTDDHSVVQSLTQSNNINLDNVKILGSNQKTIQKEINALSHFTSKAFLDESFALHHISATTLMLHFKNQLRAEKLALGVEIESISNSVDAIMFKFDKVVDDLKKIISDENLCHNLEGTIHCGNSFNFFEINKLKLSFIARDKSYVFQKALFIDCLYTNQVKKLYIYNRQIHIEKNGFLLTNNGSVPVPVKCLTSLGPSYQECEAFFITVSPISNTTLPAVVKNIMFLEMPNKIYIQIVEDSSCNIETNKGSNQIRPLEVKEYEENDFPLYFTCSSTQYLLSKTDVFIEVTENIFHQLLLDNKPEWSQISFFDSLQEPPKLSSTEPNFLNLIRNNPIHQTIVGVSSFLTIAIIILVTILIFFCVCPERLSLCCRRIPAANQPAVPVPPIPPRIPLLAHNQ